MRADVMSKHVNQALVPGLKNQTIMYTSYDPMDPDILDAHRRQIQERVLHKHRYETDRQISIERTKAEVERSKPYKRYNSTNDIQSLDLYYADRYDEDMYKDRTGYYTARDMVDYDNYGDEFGPLRDKGNGLSQSSRRASVEQINDDTRELYEKLNALKSPKFKYERGPKSISYAQKFREKTEMERRSNNSSRNTILSSNVSSRSNSSRLKMRTEVTGTVHGIPRREQSSRDTNIDVLRSSSHQGFVSSDGYGSRRNSISPSKNIRSVNSTPIIRDNEVADFDEAFSQINDVYLNRDTVKPIKVVLNEGDGGTLKAPGRRNSNRSQNLRKESVISNPVDYKMPQQKQPNKPKRNQDTSQLLYELNDDVLDFNNPGNLQSKQTVENKVQYQFQKKNDKIPDNGLKIKPSKIPRDIKQTNFDHGRSEKVSTNNSNGKRASSVPAKSGSSESIKWQSNKIDTKKPNNTDSVRSNKGNVSEDLNDAHPDKPRKTSIDKKLVTSDSQTTAMLPNRKKTNDSNSQKTPRSTKKAGSNKNKSESGDKEKPKGILRKTSSFKVIGNSSHFFGYMSLNAEVEKAKKVSKKVRYRRENSIERTRPISA